MSTEPKPAMAGKSMPGEPMPGEPMPAERTKAVDNVRRMVVEVIEVIEVLEITVAKDDGWTIDVGRTFIGWIVIALDVVGVGVRRCGIGSCGSTG
jgi:hypothetical protein